MLAGKMRQPERQHHAHQAQRRQRDDMAPADRAPRLHAQQRHERRLATRGALPDARPRRASAGRAPRAPLIIIEERGGAAATDRGKGEIEVTSRRIGKTTSQAPKLSTLPISTMPSKNGLRWLTAQYAG